ncbi:MAG: hypothetical protein ACFFAH_08120 [Promethearchaeota archaeon]
MRKIEEIGECPNCDCSIFIYKTSNYKRFAKCEICGFSYPLPKKGSISNSALLCPERKVPILIVEKHEQKVYFWTDQPCFTCIKSDNCEKIKEIMDEFKELRVYGY